MLSDPRIGLVVSLTIAALAGVWLVAQGPFAADLFEMLGYAEHAITLVSILLLLAGLAAGLTFSRLGRVKSDLLEGRHVIARWTVAPQSFRAFAKVAGERDRNDKRGALLLVLFFIVVIFGAFALFDLEAAPAMLSVAAAVSVAVVLAFFFGNRVSRKQLELRSGEVIIGADGVLVNDVLHVWNIFPSWLGGAHLESGPPAILTISYGYVTRYGVQEVGVPIPVPPEEMSEAGRAENYLNAAVGPTSLRNRKNTPKHPSNALDR